MSEKRVLRAELELLRAINYELHNKIYGLNASLLSKDKVMDVLESATKAAENACIYHQARADKAYEIIGRMVVDGEWE